MITPSDEQFDAMHVFFRHLSDRLNERGISRNMVWEIRKAEIPWTEESVKEDLWKPLQAAMYPETVLPSGKVTTKRCGGIKPSKIHEFLMGHLNQHFEGIDVPFPTKEQ